LSEHNLQALLISWFESRKRPLPWRQIRHWYNVWISEVMLQQTQVEQVIPYYLKFIKRFPSVDRLAEASEQEILKVWEGLGYYSRARNLHSAANIIVAQFNSSLPPDIKTLLKLPGFGPYITRAVLSIAFNLPYGVVDGNSKRVIARLFSLADDIGSAGTYKKIQNIIDRLVEPVAPRQFNEAMMELGALVCKPLKPLCQQCPLTELCLARSQGLENKLPVKSKKAKIPLVESIAFIFLNQGEFMMVKRPGSGLLAGMWEFPRINFQDGQTIENFDNGFVSKFFKNRARQIKCLSPIKHTYTHFHLLLHSKLFLSGKREVDFSGYEQCRWLNLQELKDLPLHGAVKKIIRQLEADSVSIAD
jgi:A/G-specific adenine glycosylase